MKLVNIHKSHLTNALHLQFILQVIKLIKKFNAVLLKIPVLFDNLCKCAEKEEFCYKVDNKSDLSELKMEIDHARDMLVLGTKKLIVLSTTHFDENVQKAARKLKIGYDKYNKPISLVNQSYDAETVGIYNLIKEFETVYHEEVEMIVGLKPWLEKLRVRNAEFEELTTAYTEQKAGKPLFPPKEIRRETDESYKKIVYGINGLIVLEGETEYAAFVNELNILIKHYNDNLAQHLGRIHAAKERAKQKEAEEKAKKEQEEKEQGTGDKVQGENND
jgi:hypothetical protein